MKYKTQYPESYREGIRNKSFTITGTALQLLQDNEIDNESAFVNDLIIDALQEKDFFKKKLIGNINLLATEYQQKYGKRIFIQIQQENEEMIE